MSLSLCNLLNKRILVLPVHISRINRHFTNNDNHEMMIKRSEMVLELRMLIILAVADTLGIDFDGYGKVRLNQGFVQTTLRAEIRSSIRLERHS